MPQRQVLEDEIAAGADRSEECCDKQTEVEHRRASRGSPILCYLRTELHGSSFAVPRAFGHLCGVAPIDASSGLTLRKRLNRGGDRSANHALWRIVMVRMVFDARTRAYVARRTAEGRSKREIIRSLKRYVARELYRCLPRPEPA